MSDDLRTAIEEAVSAYAEPETLGHRAERVLEIIEDQKYALAILNLIGDVREGWVDKPMAEDAHGYIEVAIRPALDPDHYERVFVVRPGGLVVQGVRDPDAILQAWRDAGVERVRPRGEATDA